LKLFDEKDKKCSTWPIGNDLISLCAKTLSVINGKSLKVIKFMGCENSFMNLNKNDDS